MIHWTLSVNIDDYIGTQPHCSKSATQNSSLYLPHPRYGKERIRNPRSSSSTPLVRLSSINYRTTWAHYTSYHRSFLIPRDEKTRSLADLRAASIPMHGRRARLTEGDTQDTIQSHDVMTPHHGDTTRALSRIDITERPHHRSYT